MPLHAQDQHAPMLITITYVPTPQDMASNSVSVLSNRHIEARHANSVTDLLRQVPGLHVDQAGGRGSVSSVYLRGGDPNFTVVLIDGVKVNNPANTRGGSYDFSTLDIANIERIEIGRGPLSAVFGSDAMSGVINIITRRARQKREAHAEFSAGGEGYLSTRVGAGGADQWGDYSVNVSLTDDGEPVEGSHNEARALSGNLNLDLGDEMDLRFHVRASTSDLESFPDDSGGPRLAVIRERDVRDVEEHVAGLNFAHRLNERWRYRLNLGYYQNREDAASPGVAPGVRDPIGIPRNRAINKFRRYSFDWRNDLTLSRNTRVTVGVETVREDAHSRGQLDFTFFSVPTEFDLQRDTWALFAEARIQASETLIVQGGIRVDNPEDFSSQVSPRIGAVYELRPNETTLRANWGNGFKLPSFFALGHPVVGNSTLRPEEARSVDVSIAQRLRQGDVVATLTAFHNRFAELIDLQEVPTPLLVNRSKVRTGGVELGVQLIHHDSITVDANVTYLDTDIEDSDEELRNRPRWRAGTNVNWQLRNDLNLNIDLLYVGENHDSSIPTADRELDDYLRVDLAADWQWNKNLRLFIVIENLFDADYEEAVGFPGVQFRPRLGVKASF